jgi:hypothetical protein
LLRNVAELHKPRAPGLTRNLPERGKLGRINVLFSERFR